MTAPTPQTPPAQQPWWARPAIVLPGIAGLAFAAALLSPVTTGPRSGDPRLTTHSAAPLGARLLHDLAQRLGWRTERRIVATFRSDPGSIQAVLAETPSSQSDIVLFLTSSFANLLSITPAPHESEIVLLSKAGRG